ncbi:MAG: hypothetical protein FWF87_01345 [Synergistaceae bacterium]|nr:hypothetical protein [Synergistaceae bacterium]
MNRINRNFKASVFTHLFCDPENERGLYNAFSSVQFPLDAPVVDYTLTDVLYKERVNDLAFTVGGKLVCFFEGQSTINENMALRYLIYCARVYEKLISNKAMYSEGRVSIPTPEYFVLYNGVKPFPEKKIYRLSDSFAIEQDGIQPLELIVTAYNVNKGYNEAIVKKDANLYGYVTFVARVRENEQRGMEREDAVKAAIEGCINDGILAEYLEKNASEVVNMLFGEWNWEDARAVWDEETEKRVEKRMNEKWQSVISDKEKVIADKEKMIADKEKMIADKNAEIVALKTQFNISSL